MSKAPFKKSFLLIVGLFGFFWAGMNHASAAVEFKIDDKTTLNPPGYVYNEDKGILAVPADQAVNYTTTLLEDSGGSGSGFLLEGVSGNLYNNVVNDPDAVLGYAWSERIGWIGFSHGTFNDKNGNFVIDEDEKIYPRFSVDANGDQQILKGYLWSKHAGWIQLTTDNFEKDNGQTETNWGVYFETPTTLKGLAWGPALGWIDFSGVTYNETTGKFLGQACIDVTGDMVGDCASSDNVISFGKVPNGEGENTGNLENWGVSKNMTSVYDTFPSQNCELISGTTCAGGSATLASTPDGSSVSVNFTGRLATLIGNHDLKIKVTDCFGRTYVYKNNAPDATSSDTIRFKSVVWPMNCHLDVGNNFVCDAPLISFNTNLTNGAIADGVDILELTTHLTNGSGQEVFAAPLSNNVEEIYLDLTFEDTVELNQLDALSNYNSVQYNGSQLLGPHSKIGDTVTLTLTSNNVNGDFVTNLTSLAPTNIDNNLLLKDFAIRITLDDDAPEPRTQTFSKSVDYPVIGDLELNFSPALTATITNFNHLIENTSSVFNVILENHSPTQDITDIDLNSLFDGLILPNLAGLSADLKAKLTSAPSYTAVYANQLQLVSTNFSKLVYLMDDYDTVSNDTKIIPSSLLKNSNQEINFDLKPILVLGDQIDPNAPITFETQVGYKVNGSTEYTLHKSHFLDMQNNVVTTQIDIKGLASGKQIHDINTDYSINVSGGLSFEEVSEAIRKNVADLTRNENAEKLKTGGGAMTKISNWSEGNQIKNGKVLYYEGVGEGDLVIDNNGGDFEIGDEQGTIIVIGGDVYIKSNIEYGGTGNGSFGLIVIKSNNGKGGNVYIDPAVTNLVGGIYAEGSMISALDDDNNGTIDENELFDGFSATEEKANLGNQLFINGSLISRNTIGGSRQNPIEFPKGYSETSCTGGTDEQKCSERYDLNYLRNFAVNGSGAIISTTSSGTGNRATDVSNSAFVIKYDSRIQSNTPAGFEMQSSMKFEEIVQ